MIANIPFAPGNKLNCFMSAKEMLSIIWPYALVLLFVFCVLLIFTCYKETTATAIKKIDSKY